MQFVRDACQPDGTGFSLRFDIASMRELQWPPPDQRRRNRHRGFPLPRRHLRRKRNHHAHRRRPRRAARNRSHRCRGKFVFPGFIDPHVHIYLPFMATFAKDTHATASIAALIGGTTTFIEMCCPSRNDDALEGYHTGSRKPKATAPATIPFTWPSRDSTRRPKRSCGRSSRDGTASFKIFLAYKNFFGVDDGEMYPHAQAGGQARRHRHRALRKRRACRPAAAAAARRKARPAPNGTSPAVRKPWRPKAPHDSRLSLKRPALRATSFISPAHPLCAQPSKPSCAAFSSTSNPCCRIFCSTKLTPSAPASKA